MRVAIVGAGIAGLACGEVLGEAGHQVRLFDKGRAPGGRMSTRRIEGTCAAAWQFDHGAQYATARDPAFRAQMAGWERAGVAARWPTAGADAWVGVPGMSALPRAMAERQRVDWSTRIDRLARDGEGWQVTGAALDWRADAVLVALPAEQAAELLHPAAPALARAAAAVPSLPCWTAMIGWDRPIGAPLELVRDAGAIGWAARDGGKPGRGDRASWVVQASADWSAAHLEEDAPAVAALLLAEFAGRVGRELPRPAILVAHRWRYARTGASGGPGALWDPVLRIGACGDWLLGPRVEAAWLSGRQLAALAADGLTAL